MNNRKKKSILTILLVFIIIQLSFANTGIIRGVVKEGSTQQAITGASVRITGTQQGVATSGDGHFEISKIEPGTYNIQISFLGYQDLLVEDIRVEADKIINLQLDLQKSIGETLEEVVVSASRLRNTNQAVLTEIRSARQVVSGVSQQQIKMSQDRDAAQVMSRIPGLTIVDNRFVMVRGIPERYNQVMLNNAIAPSTEVDKRTFSFDLIPSGVLEKMMIYKSGSPENPGDFAGGLIKVYTNSATGENFTTFSIGSNYRANTTFEPYVYNRTSSTDFLGFDGGERRLPKAFPTENLRGLSNSSPIRIEAPQLLNNDLSYQSQHVIPDLNFSAGLGRSWSTSGGKRVSMLNLVNYSQSNQYYVRNFNRYEIQHPSDYGTPASQRLRFLDNHYEKENRVGILTNWALTLNPFHKLEFKNLFNQIGENSAILRSGRDFVQQGDRDRRNYLYEYRSRSIYSGQLEGTHRFQAGRTSLNWVLGANYLSENQPDLRRFRTTQQAPNSDIFQMEIPSSSNLYDTGRFFGKLSETGVSNSVNFERQLGGAAEDPILLKAGYLADYRSRNFSSRYFSYKFGPNGNSQSNNDLVVLPLDQIFADENFALDRFVAEEGTNPIDSYTGSNLLSAAFAGITLPLGQFHIVGGFRGEYNILKLNSFDGGGSPVNVNNKLLSPLGFLNVDYSLGEMQKIRFAYGRQVNRPEFREIAPFLFYDFELDANRNGNPDLKTATIDNLDLRYEIYPRQGETISIGGFYKRFNNPIETEVIQQGGTDGQAFTLSNAEGAYSFGAEVEIRKSFKGMTESEFIDHFNINLNASIIKSQVDYGATVNQAVQDVRRPLQGQSPYIVNAILNYQDEDAGWNISAAYNVIGKRIYAIGSIDFPTVYELPRNAIDLTISKNLNRSLTLKIGVQDILNAPFRFYQDTNRDRKIDEVNDDLIIHYKRGTLFTTSLTYTLR